MDRVMPVLERRAAIGMPLLIHGEATDPEIDIFDREAVFIERTLTAPPPARTAHRARACHDRRSGRLCRGVGAIWRRRSGASSDHHRNALFAGGIPAASLLPADRQARKAIAVPCAAAATIGPPAFFLGTDSAPHAVRPGTACGCAGIFTAARPSELYAEVFEEGRADRFEPSPR